MSKMLLLTVLILVVFSVGAHADVPRIVYDAAALDAGGNPMSDGTYQVTFRVYEAPEGGQPVWSEMISTTVNSGRLRVELGRTNPLALDWPRPYYISTQFNSADETASRTQLRSPGLRVPLSSTTNDLAYLVADAPLYEPTESGLPVGEVPGGNWGADIGSYEGVIAYSNGDDTGSWSSLEPYGTDGYQYQCVEYIRRFYRLHLGMSTVWYGNANDYYDNGPGWGLEQYPNNGTSLPQPDDILCWDAWTYGHVAIVISATSSAVNVIHQNWSSTTGYYSFPVTNGIVYGSGCQGWLRKPGNGSDTTAPVISSVQATSIRSNAATITWTTDDASRSKVDYGLTSAYGQSTTEDTNYVINHAVGLSGLSPSTLYHYRVKSTNGAGLTSYSGDYTFTTTAASSEIILDDLDAEASYTGSWAQGTYSGGWPSDASEYRWANSATSTNATFTWRPNLTSGNYDVYVYYLAGTNRATNSPFTISYNGGSTTVYVNQTANGSQWYKIGTALPFSTGTAGYVMLSNGTGATGSAVVADAVKFVKQGSPPATPTDGTPVVNSTSGITWKWMDVGDETGYRVKDGSGVVKSPDLAANTIQWTESGLVGFNTPFTRKVYAFNAYGESAGSTGNTRYTLAQAGESTDGTGATGNVYCTTATKNTWYGSGKAFTFSNPAGFGTSGTWKATALEYKWNKSTAESWAAAGTVWNSGTISLTANSGDGDYYLHVRAYNQNGYVNNVNVLNYGPFRVDTAGPSAVTVTDEGSCTPSLDTLKASWTASTDAGSGLNRYEYAVGTSPTTQNIKGWTSNGAASSATITGLSLSENATYYVQARAVDNVGNTSTGSASNGILAAPGATPISSAWSKANDTQPLSLRNKIVTAQIGSAFWLEELDRTSAIRVVSSASVAKGNTVSVAGVLKGDGPSRYLLGDVVINSQGSTMIEPLGMPSKWLGGGGYNPATPGITGGVGQYNIGLLIRCAGRVTYSNTADAGNNYFYLDDGSGLASDGQDGVKVWCGTLSPPTSGTVIVTGVISSESIGGAVVPVVLIRDPAEILIP